MAGGRGKNRAYGGIEDGERSAAGGYEHEEELGVVDQAGFGKPPRGVTACCRRGPPDQGAAIHYGGSPGQGWYELN